MNETRTLARFVVDTRFVDEAGIGRRSSLDDDLGGVGREVEPSN